MGGLNLQELIAEVLEHVRGMWRYRWWALGVAWTLAVVGMLYVFTIPNVYRASAKVFVDTNSLLRPLMQGLTAPTNPLDEVQLVSRAILSRPNVEEVAYDTDLSLRAGTPEEMEKLVTSLQQRIAVMGGRDNIFTIQYEDINREKAREVVAAVLDTFVESAIGNEGNDAALTERALANEIDVHERRLREAEAKLARFKQENLGYMPGEYGDYYERLQVAVGNVAATQERIRVVTERRDELQRQLLGEEPVFGIMPSPTTMGARNCTQSGHLAQLEAELSALRVQFTEKYPRVVIIEETIADLEERCRAEIEAARAAGELAPTPAAPLETNPVYQNLKIQLSNAELDLVELRARLEAEENAVAQLRHDVDKITEVEAELKQLNRDYAVVQARHQELLRRWEDLQAKKRLDPVTDNVQFRRIEPPFALADPVGPNRPMLLAAVLVFALGGGGALAFGLNQVNPTFFSRESLRRAVDLPVLGTISMVLPPGAMTRSRVEMVGWVGLLFVLLASVAAAVIVAPQASALVQDLLL